MRKATIYLAAQYGGGEFGGALGAELRRLRLQRHLTQRQVGWPLTGAYVSAIEGGRIFPSLPALALLLARLDVDFVTYFNAVQARLTDGEHKK